MNNNYIISIPKDLKEIESKLFFGLTKRQIIGFGSGVVLGVIVFLLLKNISIDAAMYGLFFSVAPFIFCTIYKKDGMHVEQLIKLMIEQKHLNPQKRYYKVSKFNIKIAKERGIYNGRENQNKPRKQRNKKNEFISSTSTFNK